MVVDVAIRYVDGSEARCAASVWASQRAEGVDRVVVSNEAGSSVFSGHSVYWLYREGRVWVAGQAAWGYGHVLTPEVLFLPDGTQDIRRIEYVPDLRHRDVKLGWWWPGTTGDVREVAPWP